MNNVDWWIFPYDEEKKLTGLNVNCTRAWQKQHRIFFTVLNSVDNQYSSTFHVIFLSGNRPQFNISLLYFSHTQLCKTYQLRKKKIILVTL